MDGYAGNKEELYLLLTLSALGAILLACSKRVEVRLHPVETRFASVRFLE